MKKKDACVITVGGPPGSGTSTLCRLLKERTGFDYLYAGRVFRDRASEMGLTLAEFGDLCEKNRKYDIQLDERMIRRAREGDVILEGRMIGPLCKRNGIESFRIYVDAEDMVRASRVMERDGGTIEEVKRAMQEREESETQRYLDFYNIDPRDGKWYDLIIDSTHTTPEQELDIVLEALEKGVSK